MKSIIMSAQSVRSTIADLKTNTRRIVKLPRWAIPSQEIWLEHLDGDGPPWPHVCRFKTGKPVALDARYNVGDIAYVKEAWRTLNDFEGLAPNKIPVGAPVLYEASTIAGMEWGRLRSPLFMPEWASRLKIEITSVRCERLQAISEEDAIAEGIAERVLYREQTDSELHLFGLPEWPEDLWSTCPFEAYSQYWDSINGTGAWEEDPFVWVYGYRRVA